MRRHRVLLAVAAALAGIVALYGYALTVNPRVMALADLGGDDVGSVVETEGTVARVVSDGGTTLTLVDLVTGATVEAFVPAEVFANVSGADHLLPGARVRVEGEVQSFRGRLSVFVARPEHLVVLQPPQANRTDLETLGLNPQRFEGMTVNVTGTVSALEVVRDFRRYRLDDGTGAAWAFASETQSVGRVDAYGRWLYNEDRRRWELLIGADTPDGLRPAPSVTPPGYTEAGFGSLVSDPAAYDGQRLAFKDVQADRGEVIGTAFQLSDLGEGATYAVACFVYGWDWAEEPRGVANGTAAEFVGIFGYAPTRARWEISSDTFTLRP